MIDLKLPYPPSINHYWRHVGCRTLISDTGRRYRRHVQMMMARQGVRRLDGRLRVNVYVHPPDRRRRDLDNLLKSLLDAMESGQVYEDDSQIDELFVVREMVVPEGMVRVNIQVIGRA